jgi:hypothetical protein
VPIEVRLVGMQFLAINRDLNIREQHTDLKELEKQVRAAVTARVQVTWARYYSITVEGSRAARASDHPCRRSIGVDFSWELLEIGTYPDGKQCHRTVDALADDDDDEDSYGNIRPGVPETGVRPTWCDHPESQTSLLPATPEIGQALIALHDRFVALNEQLFKLLHQDKIASNIGKLAGQLRLTGGTK